jgi:hypothetical protein
MRHAASLLCLMLFNSAYAVDKNPVKAPLPGQILQAHSVFLINGGGSDAAYDALYDGIKTWGRFQIVGSPNQADIIFTVQAWVNKTQGDAMAITDKRTGNTIILDQDETDPQIKISITDAPSQNELWSTVLHRRLTFRSKVDKETRKTVLAYIEDLKARIGVGSETGH